MGVGVGSALGLVGRAEPRHGAASPPVRGRLAADRLGAMSLRAQHVPTVIRIVRADITTLSADAIVNAADHQLLGGGGVDGAIHTAAGPSLMRECRELRAGRFPVGLAAGGAVATGAGDLDAKWVIHAVAPNRHIGERRHILLRRAFQSALEEAESIGAESVVFPALGAGAFGWDADTVAEVARRVVESGEIVGYWPTVREITFCVFTDPVEEAFRKAFPDARGAADADAGDAS